MSARIGAALPLLLAGCGPLADGSWRGERLFSISGSVLAEEPYDLEGDLRVALFWAWGDEGAVEQSVVVETAFPAVYQLDVYTWPPDEVLFPSPWSTVPTAVGVPLLYDDVDADGRYGEGDAIVGGSLDVGVLYVPPAPHGVGVIVEDGESSPLGTGMRRVRNDLRAALCGEVGLTPSMLAEPKGPTHLVLGAWWQSFEDWDCDAEWGEWEDGCPEPEDPWLLEWCGATPEGPCAHLCVEQTDTTSG